MANQPLSSVLIVDDDPILCEVAKSYFNKFGLMHINVAHNGKDALEIIERHDAPFDFILLDLQMPGMDGIQFLRHMHKRAYQGAIGILTGEGEAISSLAVDLAKKHGLNIIGSLTKPFNSAYIDALISDLGTTRKPNLGGSSHAFKVGELKAALDQQQIIAHYQPQVDAITGELKGVEALARWLHPKMGVVPPIQFVPLAEDSGLMPLLTQQMIKNVIADLQIIDNINPSLTVSINLGAAVLQDTKFPDTVSRMIDITGRERSRFILELTESKLVENSSDSMEVLARLNLAGFELSLDDFGTEFSNIEQLRKYPFKEIKIDRSFVSRATTDRRSKAMVESCVLLGKLLGLRIIAEGIETNDDWNYLKGLGVDLLQGFRIAKPMAMDQFPTWAASYQLERSKIAISA